MGATYQDFVKKARQRFEQAQKDKQKKSTGQYEITRHAEYKMKQYGLSLQKVKGIIRSPKRIEEGVAKNTVAVMQPVSAKKNEKGEEVWKQELWVMYQTNRQATTHNVQHGRTKLISSKTYNLQPNTYKIISAWRYPGVSPKRNPIPSEILLELEDELG